MNTPVAYSINLHAPYHFQELWKEREQYLSFLTQLKDYEVEKEEDRAAKAVVESTNVRLEVRGL